MRALNYKPYIKPKNSISGCWSGHVPFAQWLIDRLRPKTIVELGVYSGCSYFAFCHAVKMLKLETKCIGVDTWEGDPFSNWDGKYTGEIFKEVLKIRDAEYAFAELWRMTFDEAAKKEIPPINILHIDGYHTYDAVKHDYETWLPKMAQNSVVLLHDTQAGAPFGVKQLLAEIRTGTKTQPHKVFEFYHSWGLGVVFIGEPCIPEMFTDPDEVQNFFQTLGEK